MTTLAQRIAASDPSRGKQHALAGAMTRDGFESVVGTAWIKAALFAEDRTQQHLVSTNTAGQRALRDARSCNL